MIKVTRPDLKIETTHTLKDVILQKGMGVSYTSEFVFGLKDQPVNTCPMIDEFLETFKKSVDESLKMAQNLNYPYRTSECSFCENEESLKDNLKEIDDVKKYIGGFQDLYKEIEILIEEFRKECIDLRAYGSEIKEKVWGYIEDSNSINLNELDLISNKRPGREQTTKKIIKLIDDFRLISLSINENIVDCESCSNDSLNRDLIEQLSSIESELNDINIEIPEKAFDNYNLIESWVGQWETTLEGMIRENGQEIREDLLKDLKNQILKYEKHLNESQKERFVNTKFEEASLIDINEYSKEFLKAEEDLSLIKEIEDYILDYNNFIKRYNQLENYNLETKEKETKQLSLDFFKLKERKIVNKESLNALIQYINSINIFFHIMLIDKAPLYYKIELT